METEPFYRKWCQCMAVMTELPFLPGSHLNSVLEKSRLPLMTSLSKISTRSWRNIIMSKGCCVTCDFPASITFSQNSLSDWENYQASGKLSCHGKIKRYDYWCPYVLKLSVNPYESLGGGVDPDTSEHRRSLTAPGKNGSSKSWTSISLPKCL